MKEGKREFGKKIHKVNLEPDLHRRLKIRASRDGRTLQAVVGDMLRYQLKLERQS